MSDATTKPDGGPAFPCQWTDYDSDKHAIDEGEATGLTVRDYFAGQSVIAIASCEERSDGERDYSIWAESAYKLADAMLKAREE